MIVLGLDQSLTKAGWATARSEPGSSEFTIEAGLFVPKSRAGEPIKRLDEIDRWMWRTINELPECPTLVALEGYAFATKGTNNAHGTPELGGCLKLSLWRAGQPFLIVGPTQRAKYAVGGPGKRDKDAVMLAARDRFGRICTGNDVADALWIAEIAWFVASGFSPSNKARREVVQLLSTQKQERRSTTPIGQ